MALDLVRGRPFEGLRTYDWTVLDGVVTAIEDAIVEVAVRLAEHWLAAGNGRAAELAARRGLVASPFDERLYRALLRAADAQANPAGVEAAMAQLLRLVVGSAGPNTPVTRADPRELDLVHPATATLYRSLSRRCARPLGALGGPARTSTAGSAVAVNSGPLDARGCGEGGCRGY